MTFGPSEARPVFAHFPQRHRLLDYVGRHDGAVLLSAPSGWGKSVLASQLAGQSPDALWCNCLGHTLSSDVIERTSRMFRERSANRPFVGLPEETNLPCVVLDDLLLTCEDELAALAALRANLAAARWRLVVATPCIEISALAEQHGFHVLTQRELAIDYAEAEAIWNVVQGVRKDEIAAVLRACAGHPALFSLLLRAGARACVTPRIEAVHSLIDDLALSQLSPDDLTALVQMAVLGKGTVGLHGRCPDASTSQLRLLEAVVPLVTIRLDQNAAGALADFVAHDLLFDWALSRLSAGTLQLPRDQAQALMDALAASGRLDRAFRFALDLGIESRFLTLLEEHGNAALDAGLAGALDAMLERVSLTESMARPALMLLWAEALLSLGRADDALGKARAARMLARHEGDRAMAAIAGRTCAGVLRDLNRWSESKEELDRILSEGLLPDDPCERARLRSGLVLGLLMDGRCEEAVEELAHIQADLASTTQPDEVALAEAAIRVTVFGDHAGGAALIAPLLNVENLAPYERVLRKGNLSAMLTECGRLERASALQDAVDGAGSPSQLGLQLRTRGMILAGLGEPGAVCAIEQSVLHAVANADEAAAAQARTYLSVVQRAEGLHDLSLVSAERAYEALSNRDVLAFRRAAAVEVAASLLALGDSQAARVWAQSVSAEGFGRNAHHRLRCALVLSECDRADGNDPAVALRGLDDFIRSGSANWLIGMYCRAFPGLIGAMSSVAGIESLPAHMLRMILPQHAEASLRAARLTLREAEWSRLGNRMLGVPLMEAFVARGAEPTCNVRLFGGLDVSVEGRTVQETAWRKKKSRLLFAMLVARRGQDVPRDQILEHLWPDLPEPRAKNNFYVVWSMMKSALMGDSRPGRSPYVESVRGRCRIVREAVRSDVDDFEDAVGIARRAEACGDVEHAVRAYERISTLYRGELLPGDLYDDWFAPLRDHYRYQFIDAMVKAAELLLRCDDPSEAAVFARRGLAADSSREELYQLALRAHIAAGQRSTAVETFMQCRYRLSEELGLDPSAETMRLYSEVLSMEERSRGDSYGLDPLV